MVYDDIVYPDDSDSISTGYIIEYKERRDSL
jgi:hypothetical protein